MLLPTPDSLETKARDFLGRHAMLCPDQQTSSSSCYRGTKRLPVLLSLRTSTVSGNRIKAFSNPLRRLLLGVPDEADRCSTCHFKHPATYLDYSIKPDPWPQKACKERLDYWRSWAWVRELWGRTFSIPATTPLVSWGTWELRA